MNKKVAVIGCSFRLPGGSGDDLWEQLLNGQNLVTGVDPRRWPKDTFLHPDRKHPGSSYTFAAGSIGEIDSFDASFFGISPREAAMMDPQQRLLLELGWETFENAGVLPSGVRGSDCGVYIGISTSDNVSRMADDLAVIDANSGTGNASSIAANRLSYFFDLRGPSMAIDTACSSTLVAFHQACRSISSGESSIALAGGVCLHLHPYTFLTFSKATMLSRRGRCTPFDAAADGYVRSEGGGLFLLKDYDRALADGDRILAVVSGSAVNADGRKSGLTVPSFQAQAALLEQVYRQSCIEPCDLDYLEAHGTGTPVGDPIETHAIGEALGRRRPADLPLPIGSIKSNIGHMEAAAGVGGLFKALYLLRHRVVPATIGYENPNPKIKLQEWNLEVVSANRPLKGEGRLVVGINSFGFGGANAHVILESPPEIDVKAIYECDGELPFVVSGADLNGLRDNARQYAEMLHSEICHFYNAAYSSVYHRDWLDQRLLLFGRDAATVARQLEAFAQEGEGEEVVQPLECSAPAFIYSGNGSQWSGMGRVLMQELPLFRDSVREVDAIFSRYGDYSIEDELNGLNGDRYEYTEIAQPTLFAMQVGITRVLEAYGVRPSAVSGHSVGEIAAAWACGALKLEQAVEVIYYRSMYQGKTKGQGAMTAVGLGREAVVELLQELGLPDRLTMAGSNSPKGVTIAGQPADLAQLETVLEERMIFYRRLTLDYAFHSSVMDPLEVSVLESLAEITPLANQTPYYSTVTGGRFGGEGLDASYWWRNIREPVLFDRAVGAMIDDGFTLFVEVGPHAILRSYLNECLADVGKSGRVLLTVRRDDDNPQYLKAAVSQVHLGVGRSSLEQFFPVRGKRASLPLYSWQRESCRQPVTAESCGLLYRQPVHPLLGYALKQQPGCWENQLDTARLPMLADHVVGNAIIFPGAGYVELALAAAAVWHGEGCLEVEEIEIRLPMSLDERHSKVVRLNINPHDGSGSISSRELLGEEPWKVHAVCRILTPANDYRLEKLSRLELPQRTPDFSAEGHKARTVLAGLQYGPAFSLIRHGWLEENTALAQFELPPDVMNGIGEYHLHPALLDCAFQLVFQVLGAETVSAGMTYVPVKIGHISIRTGSATLVSAAATVLRRTAHSVLAEIRLYDADGMPVALVEDVRFRGIRGASRGNEAIRYFENVLLPLPHPRGKKTALLGLEQVAEQFGKGVRECVVKGHYHQYAEEVEPLLYTLCSRFALEALRGLADDAGSIADDSLRGLYLRRPEIVSLCEYLFSIAGQDGMIIPAEDGWILQEQGEESLAAVDVWNALFSGYPDYFPIIHAVGRMGMAVCSLLAGSDVPKELAPAPVDGVTLLHHLLSPFSRQRLGTVLQKLICDAVGGDSGRRFEILEISCGMPLFAPVVSAELDFDRCGYTVAVHPQHRHEELDELAEHYPRIELTSFDQSASAKAHLVVLSGAFTCAEDARQAVAYAKNALIDDGILVYIGFHAARWVDFVNSGQPDWFVSEGDDPLVTVQRNAGFWQQYLESQGFGAPVRLELTPQSLSGPYLLLSRLERSEHEDPGADDRHSWLLVGEDELLTALDSSLRMAGDRIVRMPAVADHARFEAELAGMPDLKGIVLRPGLNGENFLSGQSEGCMVMAALLQACDNIALETDLWLLTGGRQAGNMPAVMADVAHAAWSGFGRSCMNESRSCTVRIVNLSAGNPPLEPLLLELRQPSAEQELTLDARGCRFVSRLRPVAGAVEQNGACDGGQPVQTLRFPFPGQLKNLRWEASVLPEPAADELDIDVQATGLNFRDVMYSLGLLSDEAVENGFSGPTLGLEFSGIVRRVGRAVTGFSAGDRVVGFGPACFSTRVITRETTVSHIPPGISFEAAATIPTTFFTSWYALVHLARLREGEKVLIHGAAGGVGLAAIQVARLCGAEIYATAGSHEKRQLLKLLGVEHVFDSRSLLFADQIMGLTNGRGIDVVLNSLAGEAINRNLQVLRPFGRFLELGKRDFYENTKVGLRPFRNNISYFGIDADQLMQEHPDLTRQLFNDIMDNFRDGQFFPLPYRAFEAGEAVAAFRYMQQSRQIGKVVVTYRRKTTPYRRDGMGSRHLALSPDAAYLVTGGLSGFGLKTAQRLAERGAKNLVLLNRSGLHDEEAVNAVAQLRRQGVAVIAEGCDITDRVLLSGLLKRVCTEMPPLKGIVHAAAHFEDALVSTLQGDQLERVLAPKIRGAWNLHQLTADLELDFFVLYSSATTLFGNPGQSAYVAANYWLEALAEVRRSSGLPAVCVGWGAIGDAGFLARNENIRDALQNRLGGTPLDSSTALDILERLVLEDRSGLGVLELEWKSLRRFLPVAVTPRFEELSRLFGGDDLHDGHDQDIHGMMERLSDDELQAVVAEMVRGEVAEILRIAPERIDISRSLYDMGLDSLMGVELVTALETRFSVRMAVMALNEGPTIVRLAERVILLLRGTVRDDEADVADQFRQVTAAHAADVDAEQAVAFADRFQADRVERMINR